MHSTPKLSDLSWKWKVQESCRRKSDISFLGATSTVVAFLSVIMTGTSSSMWWNIGNCGLTQFSISLYRTVTDKIALWALRLTVEQVMAKSLSGWALLRLRDELERAINDPIHYAHGHRVSRLFLSEILWLCRKNPLFLCVMCVCP